MKKEDVWDVLPPPLPWNHSTLLLTSVVTETEPLSSKSNSSVLRNPFWMRVKSTLISSHCGMYGKVTLGAIGLTDTSLVLFTEIQNDEVLAEIELFKIIQNGFCSVIFFYSNCHFIRFHLYPICHILLFTFTYLSLNLFLPSRITPLVTSSVRVMSYVWKSSIISVLLRLDNDADTALPMKSWSLTAIEVLIRVMATVLDAMRTLFM